jgi:hypothetical protein
MQCRVADIAQALGDAEANIFLVFPYMEHDLCGYVHSTEAALTVETLRIFAGQLLDGLKEMHRVSATANSTSLMHRSSHP